jgi:hypothetical protein
VEGIDIEQHQRAAAAPAFQPQLGAQVGGAGQAGDAIEGLMAAEQPFALAQVLG